MHCLVGRRHGNRLRLGDLLNVEVFHVDVDRRQLDFRVVAGRDSEKSAPSAKDVRAASKNQRPSSADHARHTKKNTPKKKGGRRGKN